MSEASCNAPSAGAQPADGAFDHLLTATCSHLYDMQALADSLRTGRPQLAAVLDQSNATYAGQVLELIEGWPA